MTRTVSSLPVHYRKEALKLVAMHLHISVADPEMFRLTLIKNWAVTPLSASLLQKHICLARLLPWIALQFQLTAQYLSKVKGEVHQKAVSIEKDETLLDPPLYLHTG